MLVDIGAILFASLLLIWASSFVSSSFEQGVTVTTVLIQRIVAFLFFVAAVSILRFL